MPSPFPGMDPYLEAPHLWPGVHQHMISAAAAQLNERLPRHYVADIGERVYVDRRGKGIYRDLSVFQQPPPMVREARVLDHVVADPPAFVAFEPDETREVFVKILPVGDEQNVVTIIEVLSPANKAPGRGRDLYLKKQTEVLDSETHLLEIDLLRAGAHTIGLSEELLARQGKKHYTICLHRADTPRRFEAWPVDIRQPLPRVPVPLIDGDPDVVLDLQSVFGRCYVEGAYERRLDYTKPPEVALSSEDALWAESAVKAVAQSS